VKYPKRGHKPPQKEQKFLVERVLGALERGDGGAVRSDAKRTLEFRAARTEGNVTGGLWKTLEPGQ